MCPNFFKGKKISVVDSDKHLGNFISTNIADRNITENVCTWEEGIATKPQVYLQ